MVILVGDCSVVLYRPWNRGWIRVRCPRVACKCLITYLGGGSTDKRENRGWSQLINAWTTVNWSASPPGSLARSDGLAALVTRWIIHRSYYSSVSVTLRCNLRIIKGVKLQVKILKTTYFTFLIADWTKLFNVCSISYSVDI